MFVIILLASILVRFYRIGQIPYGMNWDEVSIAYNAWSISWWHRDENAKLIPLSFISFGDYKPPGVIYMLAIPYWLFGFHLEWVRVFSAVMGVGSVILAFFIAKEFQQKHKWFPYGVMLLMALVPWGVTLSRVGFEQNTAFFFVNLGVYGLLKGLKNGKWLIFSALPIAMSLYVFHTAKIFWLGFLPCFGLIWLPQIKKFKNQILISLVCLLVLILPLLIDMVIGPGLKRSETLIFFLKSNDLASIAQIVKELWKNTINQFSYSFWVKGADAVSIRHSVPGHGVITAIEWVFLIIGLILSVMNYNKRIYQLLLVWWLMGLAPALLTHNAPHALRSLFALMPSVLIIMMALNNVFYWIGSKSWFVAKSLAIIIFVSYLGLIASYLRVYYSSYSIDSAKAFQFGYKEVIEQINQYKKSSR